MHPWVLKSGMLAQMVRRLPCLPGSYVLFMSFDTFAGLFLLFAGMAILELSWQIALCSNWHFVTLCETGASLAGCPNVITTT